MIPFSLLYLPSKDTKTISLFFNEEYFFPDGVIKKPSLYLTDIFPDLRADNFVLFSFFEYLQRSWKYLLISFKGCLVNCNAHDLPLIENDR